MQVPVVIFHVGGNQPYFINCVNISSQNNTVYLVGDDTNKHTFANNKNVCFFHINDLESQEIEKFKRCFVNYSTNDSRFEMYCFLRVFYLKTLFEKTKHTWMFHIDSDCVLLENINNIFTPPFQTAYCIENSENKNHMVGSIHNSLLNIDFCNQFIRLCFDIYDNGSKFRLIEEKIKWHRESGMPGGICDMTLYHLLHSEKIINNIFNLIVPFSHNDEDTVFDNNIAELRGYEMQNGIKTIIKTERGCYFKTVDGRPIKIASIHFQGINNKLLLENFSI
jgi:hypothetical protein